MYFFLSALENLLSANYFWQPIWKQSHTSTQSLVFLKLFVLSYSLLIIGRPFLCAKYHFDNGVLISSHPINMVALIFTIHFESTSSSSLSPLSSTKQTFIDWSYKFKAFYQHLLVVMFILYGYCSLTHSTLYKYIYRLYVNDGNFIYDCEMNPIISDIEMFTWKWFYFEIVLKIRWKLDMYQKRTQQSREYAEEDENNEATNYLNSIELCYRTTLFSSWTMGFVQIKRSRFRSCISLLFFICFHYPIVCGWNTFSTLPIKRKNIHHIE